MWRDKPDLPAAHWVEDSFENEEDLFQQKLEGLPRMERAHQALQASAKLIEYAAFELAGRFTPDYVAGLINTAAEVERKSSELGSGHSDQNDSPLHKVQ